ncbi:hypothetical protein [Mesorhizobium sp. ANAO-SY3R2]|uniref:hypothetical protein n=1 Tax=Mesorhizobium sp. ANAO-SY3R2 TaxID=3166644 RepID=UPI00366C2A51
MIIVNAVEVVLVEVTDMIKAMTVEAIMEATHAVEAIMEAHAVEAVATHAMEATPTPKHEAAVTAAAHAAMTAAHAAADELHAAKITIPCTSNRWGNVGDGTRNAAGKSRRPTERSNAQQP